MIAKSRKASKRIAALLAATLVVTASPIDASAAAKPAWSKKKTTMTVGEKYTFKVKNVPSKGKVTFSSSKKTVATVKKSGTAGAKVTAKKKGKTVIKAVVKNKKKKTVKTLSVKLTVKKKPVTKVTPKPTAKTTPKPGLLPTATPTAVTTISPNLAYVDKVNVINNTDFTVTVSATIGGKQPSDMLKAEVESKVSGSKLTFTCAGNGLTLTANYASYDANNGLITYKMDNDSVKKLQPSKNGGKVGSADGTYTVVGTNVQIASGVTTTYAEALKGNVVAGYIYDDITDEPIKNAKVTAFTSDDQKSVSTDEHGYYAIPVNAGAYTVKAETVDTMKDAYFVTDEKDVKINPNNKTACNMYLDLYNREEFFINGTVTNAETSNNVKDAVVTLYEVKADGKEKVVSTITTDEKGCFVFANSQASSSDAYKDVAEKYELTDKDGKQNASRVKTFTYNEGLERNKTYKITIEKELSPSNITDVYASKDAGTYQFSNVRNWNLGNVKMTPIAQTKKIEVNAKWDSAFPDYRPTGEKTDVDIKFCYESEKGVWTVLKKDTITVDVNKTDFSFKYDLASKKFFDKATENTYPTLPSGKYYIVLDDKNKDEKTTIVTAAIDLKAGNDISTSEMAITEGKSTSVVISCTDKYEDALNNIVEGGKVQVVKDAKGTLLTPATPVEVECGFYQKIGNDKIYIDTMSNELIYSKPNGSISISKETGIKRTIAGANYIVEPVQSYIQADNLGFTQKDVAGDQVQLKCAGAADINYIKVDKEELFKLEDSEEKLPTSFGVESIAVLNKNNEVVGTYTYEEGTTIKKDKLLSTGLAVPAEATAFKGLTPGEYKVRLDLVDFEPVVSNEFLVIDFESVTVNIENNINFTQKITIRGTIKANDKDIQDKDEKTTDALVLLYDKEKKIIVGATAYGTTKDAKGQLVGKYEFVNGENAYLEAGKEYVLVVRSAHNEGQIAFETQSYTVKAEEKAVTKQDFAVVAGANASVTITARDESDRELKNAVVSLVDSQWSEFHSFNFKEYNAGKWNDSMIYATADSSIASIVAAACTEDPNLVGIYPVSATDVKTEWKINGKLPKNKYTAYIAADEVELLTLSDVQVASSGLTELKDNILKLTAGKNAVQLTVKYTHRRSAGVSVPFDMIEVVNEKTGEIVVREYIPDTTNNKSDTSWETKEVKILVPNVEGTYTIKVYSNESFIGSETVTLQGVSESKNISLEKSKVN